MIQITAPASSTPNRIYGGFLALILAVLLGLFAFGSADVKRVGAIMISTLVSEDLTCVATGQLIACGDISPAMGVGGCFVGIFLGDVGLWLVGRLVVRRIIHWKWATRCVDRAQRSIDITRLNGRLGAIIFASRFVPGLRLPTYVAMGAAGVSAAAFGLWTFLAAFLWTSLVVLLVAHIGNVAVAPFLAYFHGSWLIAVPTALLGFGAVRISTFLVTEVGRAKLIAFVSRIWRWEFWPAWIFYLPLIPLIAWLSLRHRGFMTITAANPGIPHGGFVGESKYQILRSIRSEHVAPTVLVRPSPLPDRIAVLDRANPGFPLILKPDVGQRGAGVQLVKSRGDAIEYLRTNPGDAIVQPYHPGPFEAGIFYYRLPDEPNGHIFAITDKVFSEVVGDGDSTLEQLIWRHPRFRMQARLFLARHTEHAGRVLHSGERFRLALAGNHCQGTMFRDGAHLLTPQLQRRIDQIARTFDGFYFGRFDVRYSDVERFRAGQDLFIIELNGVTSEATNVYDPTWSLLRAYQLLSRQWRILFQIGAINRKRGNRPSCAADLLREVLIFLRGGSSRIS